MVFGVTTEEDEEDRVFGSGNMMDSESLLGFRILRPLDEIPVETKRSEEEEVADEKDEDCACVWSGCEVQDKVL